MKTYLAALSLLIAPVIANAEKPAGVLGVNNFNIYGTYETDKYPDGYKSEVGSFGATLNYNIFEGNKFGMDAGLTFDYWKDPAYGDDDEFTQDNYTGIVTGYMKGSAASPFISGMICYSHSKYGSYTYDTTWGGIEVGVEFHLSEGWYITPSASVWSDLESGNDNSDEWVFSVETGYWFTDRVMGFVSANYKNEYTKQTWFTAGVAIRY